MGESAALDGPGTDGPLLAFLRVLAEGAPVDQVGAALAEGLLGECRPSMVSAYFLDASGEWLEEKVAHHTPSGSDYARVPLHLRVPLTEVVRSGTSGAWSIAEAAARYPAVAGWVESKPARLDDEVYLVPIRRHGRVVGVLVASLPQPVERSWRLRVLLDSAATALAVWWSGAEGTRAVPAASASRRGLSITPRQEQILDAVGDGRSNAQIAAALGVSVGTVKADLARLYRLFGVSDRAALYDAAAASR